MEPLNNAMVTIPMKIEITAAIKIFIKLTFFTLSNFVVEVYSNGLQDKTFC